MNSSKSIIDKIIGDSRICADENLAQAGEKAEAISMRAEAESAKQLKECEQSLPQRRQVIIDRRTTVAKLDARRLVLGAKKEGIDLAFAASADALCKLKDKEYLQIIGGMITKNAEDGDEVVISESDKHRITAEFIGEIAKKANRKISLAKNYGDFVGGIILSGRNCDKNLTFESELGVLRENIEPQIAGILYKE